MSAVLRLSELYDQAAIENPRSTLNRPKDETEREQRQNRFNRICGEIGVCGDTLIAAGIATKTPGSTLPPLYSSVIKTEAAKSTLAFFDSDYGRLYIERLRRLGINPQTQPKAAIAVDAPLRGITFVLTGTLSQPRNVFEERIKAAGGIVQDAVTKHTRYLVAGDNVGANKIAKARDLGTGVLDEAGLLALLEGAPVPPKAVLPKTKPDVAKKPSVQEPYHQQELF